jgi:hypothetical protein
VLLTAKRFICNKIIFIKKVFTRKDIHRKASRREGEDKTDHYYRCQTKRRMALQTQDDWGVATMNVSANDIIEKLHHCNSLALTPKTELSPGYHQ